MLKNYMKRSISLLGAAAVVASAYAGAYVDITRQTIKDPTYVPGWQGNIGATSDGVAEAFSSAFKAYQNLGVLPAGHYVLTADALYRCGKNEYAKANQTGKPELNTAYIFINEKQEPVKGLFDGRETAPDNTAEAAAAFAAGEYQNKVEYDHKGGELIIGIANSGCYMGEWCCFDNFKLKCGEEDLTSLIMNPDFADGFNAKRSWDCVNTKNGEKTPDSQKDGSGAGAYRKCGGSPYNIGQQVELEAGKYRFSMLTFHRYGTTVDAEGNAYNHKWPCAKTTPFGYEGRSAKDWFTANDYDQVPDAKYSHAYLYMSKNAEKPKDLTFANSDDEGDLTDDVDMRVRIKDCWEICNGDLSIMPDNNPRCETVDNGYVEPYETKNKCTHANDSGSEREAGAAFYSEPDKWRHELVFELTATTKVWLGHGKNKDTGDGYWNPWADIKLEKWDENATSGVDAIAIDAAFDENAPVEYFNMQGVRVAEPTTGLYIVRQGNKVTKQLIRK